MFARASYSPPDRNLIDLYADAGVEFIGLRDSRPQDKFGVAVAYARVSPRARALDADFPAVYGPAWPARSFEALLTAVYQYEMRGRAGRCSRTFSTSFIPAAARPIRWALCRASR